MYYISICAIVKDENPYLEEWIEYHLNLDVDYFIIYDNNSVTPVKKTLSKYINNNKLTVIEWNIDGAQTKAYNDCLHKFRNKTFWLAYIDADEFITLKNDSSIKKFLSNYESYAGVCLNWLVYNANGNILKRDTPILQTFTKHIPFEDPINNHIKTILQPKFTTAVSVHYGKYTTGYFGVNENGIIVPDACSSFSNNFAYIRHYYTKSYEEWVNKLNRGRAATPLPFYKPENHFWLYNPDLSHRKQELQKRYLKLVSKFLTINDLHINTRKVWSFDVKIKTKQKIEQHLKTITDKLLDDNILQSENSSLYNGKTGIALFLFHYFRYTNIEKYEEAAWQLLNFKKAGWDQSLSNGLAGIGWTIEYLSQNQFIECDTNEYLANVDKLFSQFIHLSDDLSHSKGIISYGLYFLSRMSSLSFSLNYNYNIQNGRENLERIVKRIYYLWHYRKLRANKLYEDSSIFLTFRDSVIPFLLKMYKLNIATSKCIEIIKLEVKNLLHSLDSIHKYKERANESSNIKWTYTELITANVLLQTSIVLRDKPLRYNAIGIILNLLKNTDMNEDLITSCNILHIYMRMYHELRMPELQIKIKERIENVITYPSENIKLNENSIIGLRNGLAGTGLILLSLIDKREPVWDQVFLLS